ncbi:MAG TPA: Crp/Fnr family transcriptional regulator [Baekduia sp.]|nr:Crp/Fnr family transcriptional regulator [Baekduia sp.]
MEPRGVSVAALDPAWRQSALGEFPRHVRDVLIEQSRELMMARGVCLDDVSDLFALIVEGLLRVLVHSPDGRQITIRYASVGSVVGVPPMVLADPGSRLASWSSLTRRVIAAEALQKTRLLVLPSDEVRRYAETEVAVAWPLLRALALIHMEGHDLLADNVFMPVKARVARHLLDLAQREGSEIVVQARRQQIADAVGTVPEVVSRALRSMQDERLIVRRTHCLVLCDTAGLHRLSGAVLPRTL